MATTTTEMPGFNTARAALAFAFDVIRRSGGRCGAEAHIRPYTESVAAYVSLFVTNKSAAADAAAILKDLVDLRHENTMPNPGMVFFEARGPSNMRVTGCIDQTVWSEIEQALMPTDNRVDGLMSVMASPDLVRGPA